MRHQVMLAHWMIYRFIIIMNNINTDALSIDLSYIVENNTVGLIANIMTLNYEDIVSILDFCCYVYYRHTCITTFKSDLVGLLYINLGLVEMTI